MMKYTPRVRSEMAPIKAAKMADTNMAAGKPIQPLGTPSVIKIPTV